MTTAELVAEIQDGPPPRRLAALSVIDPTAVDQQVLEDWIRTLPDAEANELAGAIAARQPNASCAEEVRWIEVAQIGYEARHLPTFLVLLFSSLEGLEARGCLEAAQEWERIGDWLGEAYDRIADAGDDDALDDIGLFVLENYLRRAPVFEAFCGMIVRHEHLARQVSANPQVYLADLDEPQQLLALEEAAANGGVSFREAWSNLHGL